MGRQTRPEIKPPAKLAAMTPRTGRPPTGNARTQTRSVRFTPTELVAVKTAAARAGKTISQWLHDTAITATTRQP